MPLEICQGRNLSRSKALARPTSPSIELFEAFHSIDLFDSIAPTHLAPSKQCLSLLRLYQVDYYGNFPISYGRHCKLITMCRKIPWRLSAPQKARQRKRLKLVDKVVDTVSAALQKNGGVTAKAIERWYKEMPREEEMLPKDKYTIFDRKEKKYRKGIHKLPKWTRVSQRVNPPGF